MEKVIARESILDLLATLRAAYFIHWTGHWQTKGNPFYGDHLLLERIYTGITQEIDTLAEKIVAMYGPSAVEPTEQVQKVANIVLILDNDRSLTPIQRSLNVEESLIRLLEETFHELESMNSLSLGMNDFIAAAANAHETFVYLLRQRNR